MLYLPPYRLLANWIDRYTVTGTTRLTPTYDDLLDVLKGFLWSVPVDDDWYKTEYPAVAELLVRMPTETPRSHFQKHGYFEKRHPFAPGWRNLTEPVPFARLKTRLRIIPTRGHLKVDIERDEFLEIISTILLAVPVDELWYRGTYPDVAKAMDDEMFPSIAAHYAQRGYFEHRFPSEIIVDEEWYVSRYGHVRTGLERGVAKSPQDHFMRLGYQEGCRPTPP